MSTEINHIIFCQDAMLDSLSGDVSALRIFNLFKFPKKSKGNRISFFMLIYFKTSDKYPNSISIDITTPSGEKKSIAGKINVEDSDHGTPMNLAKLTIPIDDEGEVSFIIKGDDGKKINFKNNKFTIEFF